MAVDGAAVAGEEDATAPLGDGGGGAERSFRKWRSMHQRDFVQFVTIHPSTYLRRLKKGVPQSYRWAAWVALFRWRLRQQALADEEVAAAVAAAVPIPGSSIACNGSSHHPHSNHNGRVRRRFLLAWRRRAYYEQCLHRSKSGVCGGGGRENGGALSAAPKVAKYGSVNLGGVGPASAVTSENDLLPPLCHLSGEEYLDLARYECPFWNVIIIDAPRTFPDVVAFQHKEKQATLARLLNAFANFWPQLGYCQGMNFVMGMILLVSDFNELDSFGFANVLFELYGAKGLFAPTFPLTMEYSRAFHQAAQVKMPDLMSRFELQGMATDLFLVPWVMTLFTRALPIRTTVVVWDLLFAEGLAAVVPLIVSILKVLERYLMDMQMEAALEFLKSLRRSGECDSSEIGRMLVRHAARQQLPPAVVNKLTNLDVHQLVDEVLISEQLLQQPATVLSQFMVDGTDRPPRAGLDKAFRALQR